MKKIMLILLATLSVNLLSGCKKETKEVYDGPTLDLRYMDLEFDGQSSYALREATLERTIDGDTTRFVIKNDVDKSQDPAIADRSYSVRYLGINTPESTPTGGCAPWGKLASNYNKELIAKATKFYIQLEKTSKVDQYNRVLGYVWIVIDEEVQLLNYLMIKAGYSNATSITGKYGQDLYKAETYAKNNGLRFVGGKNDETYDPNGCY